jgi:hypothetical protein
MSSKILWASVLGIAAVLIAGGVFASNMGFKINKGLGGPQANRSPTRASTGTQIISLPFNQQTNLANAEDLINDIGASIVNSVARYVRQDDSLEFYTGSVGTNFTLIPGDAVYVVLSTDTPYIAVGSHDPGLSVALQGPQPNASPGGFSSGTNGYAYPYHSVSSTAEELIIEIEAAVNGDVVNSISRYLSADDSLEFYTGSVGTNFNLVPGEGYLINVTTDLSWVPAHY